jgi:hypothetical protein
MSHKDFFKEGLTYMVRVSNDTVHIAVLEVCADDNLYFTILSTLTPGVSNFMKSLIIKITPECCIDRSGRLDVVLDKFEVTETLSNNKWVFKPTTSGLYYYKISESMRKNLINRKLQKSFKKNIERE